MSRSIKVWSGSSWEDVGVALPAVTSQFIQLSNPASVGYIIRSAPSQSASIFQIQNNGASPLFTVDASGNILPSSVNNTSGGSWYFGPIAWTGNSPATTNSVSAAGITYVGGSGSQLFTLSSAPGQASFQLDGTIFIGDSISYNPSSYSASSAGGLVVQANGSIGGNLNVNGTLFATAKSFEINHPTKPNMKLRYGSLEGPENGVYVRGINQDSVIELPDYWTGLVDEDTITANITSIGYFQPLFIEKIENNKVYVAGSDIMNYSYVVFAERKDIEKLSVEVEK